MRSLGEKGGRNEQTIVAEGRGDIIWILPVDFFVGVSCADISVGTPNWLGNAGWGEGLDLANVGKGDVPFRLLVDRA